MLDEPKGRGRGVLQIAATISNALFGALLLIAGVLSLVLIGVVAIDIANETWVTLGERITAELGSDIAALFDTFQIDVSAILSSFAAQNNLPEFGSWVRQALAVPMVVAVTLGLASAAPLWIARGLWSFGARRPVLMYGAVLAVVGAYGLLISGAPQLIWALVLSNGLLTLAAGRTLPPRS